MGRQRILEEEITFFLLQCFLISRNQGRTLQLVYFGNDLEIDGYEIMFVGILSKTWWTSLVKPDDRPEAETAAVSEEEGVKDARTRRIDDPDSSTEEAVSADSGAVEDEDERLPDLQGSRGQDTRPGEGRGRGVRRDRVNRRERQHTVHDDDSHDDDDEIDVHVGSDSELGPDDPLDLSYEFETEPEPPRSHRSRRNGGRDGSHPQRSRVQTAKEFFQTEILYRHDILDPEVRTEIAATYRIELKGNKGGIWTVHSGSDLEVVNRREEADLIFTMQHRDFIALVNGDLNPQLAMLAQKIKVQGDYRKAVQALSLLAPAPDA